MNKTTIEWTDYTWNPVTGCYKVSRGCKNCYAEVLMKRFGKGRSFREVRTHPERLNQPLEMGKKLHGKKVFVCDVSDLFHEDVPFTFICQVFATIAACPETTFQLLTKRPERALDFWNYVRSKFKAIDTVLTAFGINSFDPTLFPPQNIWIGTSCEDQATANQRIPILLQIPAAVHFLSCEPLVGPITLPTTKGIDWLIAGGESGHGAAPMHPEWARSLRDQCAAANIPFFFKQWGAWVDNKNMPREAVWKNYKQHVFGSGYFSTEVWNLGKSKAGHLLDGKEYRAFPTNIKLIPA